MFETLFSPSLSLSPLSFSPHCVDVFAPARLTWPAFNQLSPSAHSGQINSFWWQRQERSPGKVSLRPLFSEYSAPKHKTKKQILVCSYANFYPSHFKKFGTLVKAFILIMDIFTQSLPTCRDGLVFVADMKGFGWSNFSLDLEKLFINVV